MAVGKDRQEPCVREAGKFHARRKGVGGETCLRSQTCESREFFKSKLNELLTLILGVAVTSIGVRYWPRKSDLCYSIEIQAFKPWPKESIVG